MKDHIRRLVAFCALTLLWPGPATAQITQTLQSPHGPVAAGTTLEIELLITNNGAAAAEVRTPAHLPMIAATPLGARAFTLVRAVSEPAVVTVPAAGFRRVVYTVPVPAQAQGLGVLAAVDPAYGRIAVEVLPAASLAESGATSATAQVSKAPGDGTTPAAVAPRRALGVLPYDPVYFSLGFHNRLNARFQLSLKLRPFGPADERIYMPGSLLGNLYGGFTQTSLWDLESDSKPFFDTSYKPTVLFQRHATGRALLGAETGYAVGFEHESNGQGGSASRSMNLLIYRPTLRWALSGGATVVFSPKLYYYVEKSENDDLPEYRGYGDYVLSLEYPESWKLTATARVGTAGKGSVLFDATYPFQRLIGGQSPTGWAQGYLHLQYFNGYTESLRTYNLRSPWQLRVGYMLIR